MPSKHLPLHAKATFSRILVYLRLLFHPHGTSYPRGAQHDWCDVSTCAADTPDQSQSFPPEIDLPFVNNPDTPPERLVDAIQNLKPFLPTGCELLGQGDLKIISSHPIDAGGFADVWVGERHDGTKVAIKSYRCHSSSTCLPIYLVSNECYRNVLCSLNYIGRGCTRKHWYAAGSTTMTSVSCRSLEFIPRESTHFLSFPHLWTTRTSEGTYGTIRTLESWNWSVSVVPSSFLVVSSSRRQLLRIARGLANLHSMGVVHGNFEIVR